jgi:phthalate 4,5-dioxygenase oxygenase subunit
VGVDLDPKYRPLRNRENHFWQDRQAMKAGNFTGISGFPNQDVAMWLTMGPIADRSGRPPGCQRPGHRRVPAPDARRVKAFQGGGGHRHRRKDAVARVVCAFQAIVPKTTDWRDYSARYVWTGGEEQP